MTSRFNIFSKLIAPPTPQTTTITNNSTNDLLGPNFEPTVPIPTQLSDFVFPSSIQTSPSYSPQHSNNNNNNNHTHSLQSATALATALNTPTSPSALNQNFQNTPVTALFRFPIPNQYLNRHQHTNLNSSQFQISPRLFSNTAAFAFSFALNTQTSIYSTIYKDAISAITKVNFYRAERNTQMIVTPLSTFTLDKPTHSEERKTLIQHSLPINTNPEIIEIIDETETATIPSLSLSSEIPLLYTASTTQLVHFFLTDQTRDNHPSILSSTTPSLTSTIPRPHLTLPSQNHLQYHNHLTTHHPHHHHHHHHHHPQPHNSYHSHLIPRHSHNQEQDQHDKDHQSQGNLVETRSLKSKSAFFSPLTEFLADQIEEEEELIAAALQSQTSQQDQEPIRQVPTFDEIYLKSPQLHPHHLPLLSELVASQQEQTTALGARVLATSTMATGEWLTSHYPSLIQPLSIVNDLLMVSYYLNVPVSAWELANIQQQSLGLPLPLTPSSIDLQMNQVSSKTIQSSETTTSSTTQQSGHKPTHNVKNTNSSHAHSTSTTVVTTSAQNHQSGSLLDSYLQSFIPPSEQQSQHRQLVTSTNLSSQSILLPQHSRQHYQKQHFPFSSFANIISGSTQIPHLTHFRSILSGDLTPPSFSMLHLPRFMMIQNSQLKEKQLKFAIAKTLSVLTSGKTGLFSSHDTSFLYFKLLSRNSNNNSKPFRKNDDHDDFNDKNQSTPTIGQKAITQLTKDIQNPLSLHPTMPDPSLTNINSTQKSQQSSNIHPTMEKPQWYDDLVYKNFPQVQHLVENYTSSPSLLVYTVPISMMLGDIFPTLNLLANHLQTSSVQSTDSTTNSNLRNKHLSDLNTHSDNYQQLQQQQQRDNFSSQFTHPSYQNDQQYNDIDENGEQFQNDQLSAIQQFPSSANLIHFDDSTTFNPTLSPIIQQPDIYQDEHLYDDSMVNNNMIGRDFSLIEVPNDSENSFNSPRTKNSFHSGQDNTDNFSKPSSLAAAYDQLLTQPTSQIQDPDDTQSTTRNNNNSNNSNNDDYQKSITDQMVQMDSQFQHEREQLQDQFQSTLSPAIDTLRAHLTNEQQLKQQQQTQLTLLQQYNQQSFPVEANQQQLSINIDNLSRNDTNTNNDDNDNNNKKKKKNQSNDDSKNLNTIDDFTTTVSPGHLNLNHFLYQQQQQYSTLQDQFNQMNNYHNYYYDYTFDEMDRIVSSIDIIIDYLYSYRYCLLKRSEYLSRLQNTLLEPYISLCTQHLVSTKLELKSIRSDITRSRKDIELILTQIESTKTALSTSVALDLQKTSTIDRLTNQLSKLREQRLQVMKQLDHSCQLKASKEQQYDLLKILLGELATMNSTSIQPHNQASHHFHQNTSSNEHATNDISNIQDESFDPRNIDQPTIDPSTFTGKSFDMDGKQQQSRSFHRCEHALRSEYLLHLFGNTNSVMFLYNLSLSFLLRLEWVRTMNKCLIINHTVEQLFLRQHDIISQEWL